MEARVSIRKIRTKDYMLKTGDILLYDIIERKTREEKVIAKILRKTSI